jgi:Mce-associated membrane protein
VLEELDIVMAPMRHSNADNVILRAWLEAISAPRCGCAGDGSRQVTDSDTGPETGSEQSASLAEAEEEVLRAEARAEAAQALATQLRQDAEAGSGEDAQTLVRARRWRPPRVRPPGRKTVAVGVGILLACASLGASGYMMWRDHAIMHKRQLAPEFAAAARLGVTTLMTIDPNHAKDDIQRSIDASTGDLKTQLAARAAFMAQKAEESKVISKVTVQAVGVESFTDNSGVALVSAKSDVTDPDNSKRPPMLWRISVKIERDGGQLKMSGFDFLQ